MKDDPKYWEEVVLPNIQKLKAKQKEVTLLMDKLEAIAYDKAGYINFSGIWRKMPENWDAKH